AVALADQRAVVVGDPLVDAFLVVQAAALPVAAKILAFGGQPALAVGLVGVDIAAGLLVAAVPLLRRRQIRGGRGGDDEGGDGERRSEWQNHSVPSLTTGPAPHGTTGLRRTAAHRCHDKVANRWHSPHSQRS